MVGKARGARAGWGTLSRGAIIDAALARAGEAGVDELTARGLAAALGVSPMALYRHVHSMDEVVDEVVGRLLADRWRPKVAARDWRRWALDAADRLRRFLVENPSALHVYLRRPVTSPTAITRMDTFLTVLRTGLGDDERARHAYAAIQTYTIGFAALESAREGDRTESSPRHGDEKRAELTRELATYTTPSHFRTGLGYLLDGLTAPAPDR